MQEREHIEKQMALYKHKAYSLEGLRIGVGGRKTELQINTNTEFSLVFTAGLHYKYYSTRDSH